MTTYDTKAERQYLPFVRSVFTDDRLISLAFAAAIIKHESNWRAAAVARDPRDLARGGSFGLAQISLKTALALDPDATPDLLKLPSYNASLFGKLTQQNRDALSKAGKLTDANLIAAHNAGIHHVLTDTIPHDTATKYVPAVLQHLAHYREFLKSQANP